MQEFNLILYIVIISLFQVFINFVFNYIIHKTISRGELLSNTKESRDNKIFKLMLFIINSICFLYSLYYLLIFIKSFLLPEFIQIFLSFEPLL